MRAAAAQHITPPAISHPGAAHIGQSVTAPTDCRWRPAPRTWPARRACSAGRAASRPRAGARSRPRARSSCSRRLCRVDGDRVALLDQRDRPAHRGLGRDVADDHAVGAAREAAVGDQADRVAEPRADDRRGRREHLAHAGSALRPFVADHEHVARLDLACEDRLEAVLLATRTRAPGRSSRDA